MISHVVFQYPTPQEWQLAYRQEVETVYVSLSLLLLHQNWVEFDPASLIHARMHSTLGSYLTQQQCHFRLSQQEGMAIEVAVAQAVAAYVKEVQLIQFYQLSKVGLDTLDYRRKALGLRLETAHAINTFLLSVCEPSSQPSSYRDRLMQYDHAVAKAVQRDGVPLREETIQNLRRLQAVLSIADKDVIPYQEVYDISKTADVFRTWRHLNLLHTVARGCSTAPHLGPRI